MAATDSSSSFATGVVIRFHDKGYGFIKPDSSADDGDLFVHYTEIQSEGFRTLQEGQKVKFLVSAKDGKKHAVNVTALDGSNIERRRRDGSRDGGRRYGFSRNGNGVGFNEVECYNCGGLGHIAKDCSSPVVVRTGGNAGCYACGGKGHIARECTRGSGGRVGGGCYKCGEEGHLARDCTSVSVDAGRGSRGGNGGGFDGSECYQCGAVGHFARNCENRGGSGGRGNSRSDRAGGYKSGGSCYNCGEPGHFARECPNPTTS